MDRECRVGRKTSGMQLRPDILFFFLVYDGENKISNLVYNKIKKVGYFNIEVNKENCPKEEFYRKGNSSIKNINFICNWGGLGPEDEPKNKLECELKKNGITAYCLEGSAPDTMDIYVNVQYLNDF